MSLTRTVPASVPSLFHNSRPVSGREAVKNKVLLTRTRPLGYDDPAPGLMSLRSTVPASVPALVDGSPPRTGREPWASGGTEAGTALLDDINPGAGSAARSGLARRSTHWRVAAAV